MVEISADAARQVRALRDHYDEKGRPEDAHNLEVAVARAVERIGRAPLAGLSAPRPYPKLAREGRLWIKEGRYWFDYRPMPPPPAIVAVFFDAANLPARASRRE